MSDDSAVARPEPGSVFLEKYRVDQVLGEGGMGIVFAATHLELQDRVAIKLLREEAIDNSEVVTRFLREARAAAKLRSENVVRVYDVGRLSSGEPYMIMELLDGNDLASGPLGADLPVSEAVDYVIQACDAMAAAHELGMVHRDLKPANLFLTRDRHGVPTVKVLDFGISKLQQQPGIDGALTQESAVMGSPLYMSPEQVRSAKDVDARADIWSLGTILYELIAGRPPFLGETLGAILTAVAAETPLRVSLLRPETPAAIDAIVAKCLEKDRAQRFASALELQQALLPYGTLRSQAKMALRGSVAPPPNGGLPIGGMANWGTQNTQPSSFPPTDGTGGYAAHQSSAPPPNGYVEHQPGGAPAFLAHAPSSEAVAPPTVKGGETHTNWSDTASARAPAPVAAREEPKRRAPWGGVAAAVGLLFVVGAATVFVVVGGLDSSPSAEATAPSDTASDSPSGEPSHTPAAAKAPALVESPLPPASASSELALDPPFSPPASKPSAPPAPTQPIAKAPRTKPPSAKTPTTPPAQPAATAPSKPATTTQPPPPQQPVPQGPSSPLDIDFK